MIDRIVRKIEYWQGILQRQRRCNSICRGHQVKLHNWSSPFEQDMWLVDFIEKRGLLDGTPSKRIALYSIFAPMWISVFDRSDARIFVERENLHKPTMQGWLHRFLDDKRIDLSIGFDQLDHPQYFHLPFWVMWNVFSPTETYDSICKKVDMMNSRSNHSYHDRMFCTFICSHGDDQRKLIFNQLSEIDRVTSEGRWLNNSNLLKSEYNDDKLSFLRAFRFNLTPENSNYPGYVTEKLFEAISAGCVPIYNGSDNNPEPQILNRDAIVFFEMGKENTDTLNLIRELNSSEKLYMDFASQPRFKKDAPDYIWEYFTQLETRLKYIIQQL